MDRSTSPRESTAILRRTLLVAALAAPITLSSAAPTADGEDLDIDFCAYAAIWRLQ